MIGESNQDSNALAEEFLQENGSLLQPEHGKKDHDCYEAHLQEVFRYPDF